MRTPPPSIPAGPPSPPVCHHLPHPTRHIYRSYYPNPIYLLYVTIPPFAVRPPIPYRLRPPTPYHFHPPGGFVIGPPHANANPNPNPPKTVCPPTPYHFPPPGGFVIGPPHALMNESEAMDLHSQTRHRIGTGLGLRPGTGLGLGPGQPLATTPLGAPGGTSVFSRLTHAAQWLLGRHPSPSPSTNTATNTAHDHDPLNQVRGGGGSYCSYMHNNPTL